MGSTAILQFASQSTMLIMPTIINHELPLSGNQSTSGSVFTEE